jgi:hypothetical protein
MPAAPRRVGRPKSEAGVHAMAIPEAILRQAG